jgi:hypothetical protein
MADEGVVQVKLEIDESKIHIIRFADRMRSFTVGVLENIHEAQSRVPPNSDEDAKALAELGHAIEWLKNLEV